jgi:peptidoglycan/xylan/chitin deacetylase (PgdA/CDA1 family)
MAKKQKSHKHFIIGVSLISFGVFFAFIFNTFLFSGIADNLLARDHIGQAKKLYQIASLNPFIPDLDKRLLATDIIIKERTEENEETGLEQTIAFQNNEDKNVLGVGVSVPVLMYHYIRVNPVSTDKVGYNLSVTPTNFAAQMGYLASNGYHTISLDELGNALLHHGSLPSKPIVITFDDGYADCYTAAFPVLKSHGFKGNNFIITGLVGAPNYLTWGQIDEMKNSGVFTFGSHTVHHYALTSLSQTAILSELTASKNILQAHLGYSINWFAYPYGNVNATVASITKQAGYVGAFGTNYGTFQSTDSRFTEPRVRIGGGDTITSFAAKIP